MTRNFLPAQQQRPSQILISSPRKADDVEVRYVLGTGQPRLRHRLSAYARPSRQYLEPGCATFLDFLVLDLIGSLDHDNYHALHIWSPLSTPGSVANGPPFGRNGSDTAREPCRRTMMSLHIHISPAMVLMPRGGRVTYNIRTGGGTYDRFRKARREHVGNSRGRPAILSTCEALLYR